MSAGRQFNIYAGRIDIGPTDDHHTPELVLFNRVYTSGTVRVTGHLRDGFSAPDHDPSESVPTRVLNALHDRLELDDQQRLAVDVVDRTETPTLEA